MRKSSYLFMQSSKPFIGYDNVSYEESFSIPDEYGYIYFVPQNGVHFTSSFVGIIDNLSYSPINPYEIYDTENSRWISSGQFNHFGDYPDVNQLGRIYGIVNPAHLNWNSAGNLGYKTISEYNDLLSQMDNATKRNLTGTRLYS